MRRIRRKRLNGMAFLGVVWVALCFEEVLMFVCWLCMEICFDVVVDEMNLDTQRIGIVMSEFDARVNRVQKAYEGF